MEKSLYLQPIINQKHCITHDSNTKIDMFILFVELRIKFCLLHLLDEPWAIHLWYLLFRNIAVSGGFSIADQIFNEGYSLPCYTKFLKKCYALWKNLQRNMNVWECIFFFKLEFCSCWSYRLSWELPYRTPVLSPKTSAQIPNNYYTLQIPVMKTIVKI